MSLEHEWAAALFRLTNRTSGTGEEYFRGLVSALADVLSVRWAYISRLHPDVPGRVQVVAGWADGEPATNIEYDLIHTPCAEVLSGGLCFYPTRVAESFPLDRMLVDYGIDSYAATPLRSADGQTRGLLSIMHDRPIDASRDPTPILRLVAGRAAAELERSRVEAQLRELDRRKDEFLAMLAHELRNPLAPILHALDVQAGSGDDLQTWKEMHHAIERQVRHLVRLVDDLLDVSRLTMGRITLRCEPVDIREIVTDALETCREIIDSREHRVTLDLSPDSLVVDGDRVRLVQVLTNILNNAAKFTEPCGQIDIVAGYRDGAIELVVGDSGVGIPQERLPHIFEPFSQGESSPDRVHNGLGVGLTLAHRLVDMHAGSLTASSAGTRRGSEFRIVLPQTTAAPLAQTNPGPLQASRADRGDALHILVIEDNADTSRALERLLRMMGHVVSIARDGTSGIELAQQLRPDVILLDIGLPRMDGYSVARRLRSLPDLATTRIIALTGYGHEVSERVRAAGIDGHLVKPADAADVEEAIYARSS